MAFQAPAAVQNTVSTSSNILITMVPSLRASCSSGRRQAAARFIRWHHSVSARDPASVVRPQAESATRSRRVSWSPTLRSQPSRTAVQSSSSTSSSTFQSCRAAFHTSQIRCALARKYSTSPYVASPRPRSTTTSVNVRSAMVPQRSLFGGPSHNQLARLEAAANGSPQSSTAQVNFNQALLKANMPNIVVERYRAGKFASNGVVEQTYRTALERTGQSEYEEGSATDSLTPQQLQSIGQAVGARVGGGQIGKLRAGTGAKSTPLYVVVEESVSNIIFKWVRWLVGLALAAYVSLVVISLLIDNPSIMKKGLGSTSAEVRPEHQNTRFTDVQGCDEAKEELADIVDFLKNPERYNKLGGRLPKGVLLIGPPGTGKTLLARAVAGEAGVPFFYMSGSEFDEVYVGVGAKRVRELFSAARAKAPAIVFIDELDAVGGKRQSRDANYHRQTLNQLLNDLDGFDQSTGVIFIAATNHPDLLDKALLRPGRFDRHVQVELPDVGGRLAILKHHTRKIRLSPDVDLSGIARGTPGFSGAELENLANTAAVQASKHQAKFVSLLDLEWAKDKIMMGSERKSRKVPLADKLHTAYHEGGHTLVGLYTKGFNEVHKATILPRGHAAGITYFLPNEENHRYRSQYIRQLQVCMGGKMAEEIVFGGENVGDGVSGDIEQATKLAYMMVTSFGFSEKLGNVDFRSNYEQVSPETKRLIDNEVRRLIDEAKESAKKLLLEKRGELDHLATALVQYETLDKDEIFKVIKGENLPGRLKAMPDTPIKLPEITVSPAQAALGTSARGGDGDDGVPA